MKTFYKLLMVLVFLSSCQKPETNEPINPDLLTESARKTISANNAFAFDFFNKINKLETQENYMVSPLSLSIALGMVYNGSDGTTKEAFENVLHYEVPLIEVNEFNKNIIDHLKSSSNGSVMEIANSIWSDNGFPVKQPFIDLNTQYYEAEVRNLDFDNPSSVDIINGWVSDKTHQKIPTIIQGISSDEVMFLINALYFKAQWETQFETKNTSKQPFYISDSNYELVDMMNRKSEVAYLQNDLFSSVILPYKNEKFSMVILLPNESKTTNDIISQLNPQNWENWLQNFHKTTLPVSIPKFKMSYENKLNDEMIDLGLGIAFSDTADFSNISDISLCITQILQKTYIDVNEEGTEAAAVTVVGVGTTSAPLEQFVANKPFLYLIKENATGSICFMGKVGKPVYEN